MTWSHNPKIVRVIFGLSLLLNLFFVGFAISRIAVRSRFHRHGEHAGMMERGAGPLRQLVTKKRKAFAATRQEVRLARNRVHDALVAVPFDDKAFASALANLRQTTSHAQQTMHEALVEAAKNMSRDERRAMAESRRLWRGPKSNSPGKRW